MQVLGYVRVSTEEQGTSGAGLEAQRAAILAECKRRGLEARFRSDRGCGLLGEGSEAPRDPRCSRELSKKDAPTPW